MPGQCLPITSTSSPLVIGTSSNPFPYPSSSLGITSFDGTGFDCFGDDLKLRPDDDDDDDEKDDDVTLPFVTAFRVGGGVALRLLLPTGRCSGGFAELEKGKSSVAVDGGDVDRHERALSFLDFFFA